MRFSMPRLVPSYALLILLWVAARPAVGFEKITFKDEENEQREVVGELLIEAQDGGVMLQGDDGQIWMIQPKQIVGRESNDQPLTPLNNDQVAERLLEEFDDGFAIYRTQNYVVAYNCSEEYAKRVAALFEQLHRNFFAFWENQRWVLPEPRFPLIAVVLRDHETFLKHAREEIGETADSVIGYYHLTSNRMTTFNVPNWERNVATIIHEATHQLAYNCGLQKRFADNPMWVSEGLATFFESPDLRNPGRWRSIGRVNRVNLMKWRRYVMNRPEESLATLLADDTRFRNPATASDAYAEGWAFTYFLIKTHRADYVRYLQSLSEGKPLAERTQRERITMFEKAMNCTLADLDKAFVTYMRRVR
jgi:hypothetical protein